MNTHNLRAELSIKMLKLEKAIDLGMPYTQLKKIYLEIKELQYRFTIAEADSHIPLPKNDDVVLE